MAPDPTTLGSDILLGPLALLAFIFTAIGYAAREYRKAREARVDDLTAQRDEARDDVADLTKRLDAANDQILDLKEAKMLENNELHARLVRARSILIDKGVDLGELP